jgi:hypothetical protein
MPSLQPHIERAGLAPEMHQNLPWGPLSLSENAYCRRISGQTRNFSYVRPSSDGALNACCYSLIEAFHILQTVQVHIKTLIPMWEPGVFRRYSNWLQTGRPEFDSLQRKEKFLLFAMSKSALGPTQPSRIFSRKKIPLQY